MTMTTANLDPKNMLILAAVGIGLYYFATHRAVAKTASSGTRAAANRTFFTSPSKAGSTLEQQAATANRNNSMINGLFGLVNRRLGSNLQPSVTSAIPSDMRQSEKASYDYGLPSEGPTTGDFSRADRAAVDAPADALTTGDFSRADRASGTDDSVVANPPGNTSVYDASQYYGSM
jgi:hypothetical protein